MFPPSPKWSLNDHRRLSFLLLLQHFEHMASVCESPCPLSAYLSYWVTGSLRVRDNHTGELFPKCYHQLVIVVHAHTPSVEEQRQEDLQLEVSQSYTTRLCL